AAQRLVFDGQHVLQRDGHTEQWTLGVCHPGGQRLVSGVGLAQGIVCVVAQKAMDSSVDSTDLVQARVSDRASGGFPGCQASYDLGDAELIEHDAFSQTQSWSLMPSAKYPA